MANNTSIPASNLTTEFIVFGVLFALVSLIAFIGNLISCIVLLKHRYLLKKPHHALIFMWSVIDLLTGKKS